MVIAWIKCNAIKIVGWQYWHLNINVRKRDCGHFKIRIWGFEALLYGINSSGWFHPLSAFGVWNSVGKGDTAALASVRNLGCEPGKIKKTKQIQSWQWKQWGDQNIYIRITEGMRVTNYKKNTRPGNAPLREQANKVGCGRVCSI